MEVYNDGGVGDQPVGDEPDATTPASPRKFVFGNVELAARAAPRGRATWASGSAPRGERGVAVRHARQWRRAARLGGVRLPARGLLDRRRRGGEWRLATPSLGAANTPVAMGDPATAQDQRVADQRRSRRSPMTSSRSTTRRSTRCTWGAVHDRQARRGPDPAPGAGADVREGQRPLRVHRGQ